MSNNVFKQCSMCSTTWKSVNDFIDDHSLKINGYQVDFERLEYGLFYFTHNKAECGSTLSVHAKDFLHLNPNNKYPERKTGLQECSGHCLDKKKIDRCLAHCECAFVRDIIHILEEHRKNTVNNPAPDISKSHVPMPSLKVSTL